jgi:hypothetical protein
MSNIVFNIAKGKVGGYYDRVKGNDPATSRFVLIPLETTGLESDATLIDKDDVAALLAGTTNEQSTMGRKYLTDSDLAAIPAPDDANDRLDLALPTVTWSTASGNPISKCVVAYDPNSSADSAIIPLVMMDFAFTPDGNDIVGTGATFFRAA